jgi:hypothetical protein
MCTVAAASGAASVRVWHITSGGLSGAGPPSATLPAPAPSQP